MAPSHGLATMLRLRMRRRALAAADLAGRAAEVAALDRELAATRAAEAAARAVPSGDVPAAALIVAWERADWLARRATGLLDDRVRVLAAVDGARDTLWRIRRDEQQLARLAARRAARVEARAARDGERQLDDMALRSHGRRR
jgi:hypothetical protein